MAQALKPQERVTVDRIVSFPADSQEASQGLTQVSPGEIGEVVGPASTGRSTIVNFGGTHATISNQRLERTEPKPDGRKGKRKKRGASAAKAQKSAAMVGVKPRVGRPPRTEETSEQLITMLANSVLLNGGLSNDANNVIQIRFAELPEHIKKQIQALITAKLAVTPKNLK